MPHFLNCFPLFVVDDLFGCIPSFTFIWWIGIFKTLMNNSKRRSSFMAGRSLCMPAFVFFFALCIACLISCNSGSGSSADGSDDTIDDGADDDVSDATCDEALGLFSVQAVLENPEHDCNAWIGPQYGRVAKDSIGTAAIWSRSNDFGLGLLLGASHTLGEGWFGDGDISAEIVDPSEQGGVARLQLTPIDGSMPVSDLSPLFDFFHPEIPSSESGGGLLDIRPRHDFYLAVVDSQIFESGPMAPVVDPLTFEPLPLPISPVVDPLTFEPLPLFDPTGVTETDPIIAVPAAGDQLMIMGYPRDGEYADEMAGSVARVLSDGEALAAIDELASAGDEEGGIAYDAEAEMILRGEAVVGMSGSSAFDRNGNIVGVVVRASDPTNLDGVQYIRAVRAAFVASALAETFAALPPEDREITEAYLPASLLSMR
jgi:hypothetical protein